MARPQQNRGCRTRRRAQVKTRLLRSLAFPPRYRGQFRRRPEEIGRCRLDLEAIVENSTSTLAAKESGGIRKPGTIVTPTPAASVAKISEGFSADFRALFGTHFFNPRATCACLNSSTPDADPA